MERKIKAPSKCPVCQSSKIRTNELGDMRCDKDGCSYQRLSATTLQKRQNDNDFQ